MQRRSHDLGANSWMATGRILLGVAFACFGLHYLLFAGTAGIPAPGSPCFVGGPWVLWGSGAILLALGLALMVPATATWAALLLGTGLLLRVLIVYLPILVAAPHDAGAWTSGFEVLAMSAGAFALGLAKISSATADAARRSWSLRIVDVLFAASMVVFGVQHLLYSAYVASLVPGWVPWHMFWAYFFGFAFFAAALAIVLGRIAFLASALLGVMFLLWLVALHIPLVIAAPHNGDLWTSAIVPLAIAGASFLFAGTFWRARRYPETV